MAKWTTLGTKRNNGLASGLALALITAFGCVHASAATIPINDPSFETPALACSPGGGCFGSNGDYAGNWTLASGISVVFKPGVGAGLQFIDPIPDGSQVAAVGAGGLGGDIFQDLSATLQANTTYTLDFAVGQRTDSAFIGYIVSLETSLGVVLQSDSLGSPASGSFTQRSIVFNSGASPAQLGDTLRIDISVPTPGVGGNQQDIFDNFSLTADATVAGTPEPGSLMLGCSGLLFLAGALRRKLKH